MRPQLASVTAILLLAIFSSCGGKNFEEATIPTEQRSAEMAFRRLANHGELEAVVTIDQQISDWQFYVSGQQKISAMNRPEVLEISLSDPSGIQYTVSSEDNPLSQLEALKIGTYGYATGQFVGVERDLAAGKIYARLRLREWRERGEK